MDNADNSYVNDTELTVFYQLLHAAPQLAATLYRRELNEGVRAWLNDLFTATSPMKQRWLTALFLYYGLSDRPPMSYAQVGTELEVAPQTARALVARALRHLWLVTHTKRAVEPEDHARLFDEALVANEWRTCDPSDNVSFEGYMDERAATQPPRTAKTTTNVAPEADEQDHKLYGVDLWKPRYAEKLWPTLSEERVVMKGGVMIPA